MTSFFAKLQAEAHIDELAETSKKGMFIAPDTKKHSFAKDGFNYRTAYFLDGDGKYYRITISVGVKGTINTIYNVGRIMKTAFPVVGELTPRGSKAKAGKAATESVAQKEENVKPSKDEPRYSMQPETMRQNENIEATKARDAFSDALAQTQGHRINAVEADKLAARVLRESNSRYDQNTLAGEIAEVYQLAENGADAGEVQAAQADLMAKVLEKSQTLVTEHEERAKPIREKLRTTPVKLTDAQWAEAVSQEGSAQAYRKGLFGRVRISNSANVTLDQLWGELSEMDPELFPEGTRETDMPRVLADAVDALKPMYENRYGFNAEEGARHLAMQMNEEYLKLPGVRAAAKDQKRLGLSAEQYRRATDAYREQSQAEFDAALEAIRGAKGMQQKTERQRREAALRKKYSKWRATDLESRRATELRAQIRTIGLDLSTRLTQPKGERYIPQNLLSSVAKTCDGMVNAMQADSGADTKIGQRIRALSAELADMKNVNDPDYASEDYTGLEGMAQQLTEEIGDASLREMTLSQLTTPCRSPAP